MLNEITIFTDGASRGNPGRGGWGAIIISNFEFIISNKGTSQNSGRKVKEIGGGEDHTTNNRMELTAAIEALSYCSDIPSLSTFSFMLYTDSSYLVNGITKWIYGWQKNDWKTKTKDDVENRDLWEELFELSAGKKIDWKVISGHAGVAGNERCDEIATAFADGKRIDLFDGDFEKYSIKNILEIPVDGGKSEKTKTGKARSKAIAYSYISAIDGKIEIHKTWKECEARVKGKNAKYKKALSHDEERQIIAEFSK